MNYDEMKRRYALPEVTHYEILDVSPSATKQQLTDARRAVALIMHPDRKPDDHSAAMYMSRANLAFDVLTDPVRHKMYKLFLRSTHDECAKCCGKGTKFKQNGFKARTEEKCAACAGVGWLKKTPKK